ncbi:MAG: hypothetical protein AAGF12_22910 [Myxococcota bacterium]
MTYIALSCATILNNCRTWAGSNSLLVRLLLGGAIVASCTGRGSTPTADDAGALMADDADADAASCATPDCDHSLPHVMRWWLAERSAAEPIQLDVNRGALR